jgi:hypothetical protein
MLMIPKRFRVIPAESAELLEREMNRAYMDGYVPYGPSTGKFVIMENNQIEAREMREAEQEEMAKTITCPHPRIFVASQRGTKHPWHDMRNPMCPWANGGDHCLCPEVPIA